MGALTDQLRRDPPGLHAGGEEYWGLAWEALEWLERELRPGMATLETGSGASTLVFAAAGSDHEAVTPAADEEERFRAQAAARGIDASRVAFRIGLSHEVLPGLEQRPLDLVLVDGAHGFPYPTLDWWHVAPRVKVGGRVLLDDAYMPPVRAIVEALRADPSWELDDARELPDRRGAQGRRRAAAVRLGRRRPHELRVPPAARARRRVRAAARVLDAPGAPRRRARPSSNGPALPPQGLVSAARACNPTPRVNRGA